MTVSIGGSGVSRRAASRYATVMILLVAFIPAPTPAPVSAGLQSRIDAASAGTTLNLTGLTFNGGGTVNKALTILGGTIYNASGTSGLKITASNVTVDGVTVVGPHAAPLDVTENGIWATGTDAAHLTNIAVRNSTISMQGGQGVFLQNVDTFTVYHNTITDIRYAGIRGRVVSNGTINQNTVERLDMGGAAGDNAWNIIVEDFHVVGVHSHDVVVADNVITDNPWWHGLDTHGGTSISFLRNTVRRVRCGIFLTNGGDDARNLVVTGNQILSPYPVTLNVFPITTYAVVGATFTGNTISGWGAASPPATAPWSDHLGLSTGLVNGGGNLVTP